ncbi:MAG: hypothetical protein ACRDQW_12775 [Haloechinothrix sp.]
MDDMNERSVDIATMRRLTHSAVIAAAWISAAIQLLVPSVIQVNRSGVIIGSLTVIAALAAVLTILGPRLAVVTRLVTRREAARPHDITHSKSRTGTEGGAYSRIWRQVTVAITVQVTVALTGVLLLRFAQYSTWLHIALLSLTSILTASAIAFARRSFAQVELARHGDLQAASEILAQRGKVALGSATAGMLVLGTTWVAAIDATILSSRLLGNASYVVMALASGLCVVAFLVGDRIPRLAGSEASVKGHNVPLDLQGSEVAVTPAVLGLFAVFGAFISRVPVHSERISAFASHTALVVMAAILILGAYLAHAKTQREAMRTPNP